MDIIGGGKMHVYPSSDEFPHQPGAEEYWQESFVLHFWDRAGSAGGYFRIGHEPNYNGGTLALWSNIVSPNGFFHRVDDLEIAPGDITPNGFSGGKGALRYEYDGERIRWMVDEPGISAELVVEDFHPAVDGYRRDGKVSQYAAQHVEVACRVTGTVTTQGNTYRIDALGMRDHGWGVRHWNTMLSHRWTVGTFDRDNSFCAVAMHTTSDVIAKFGWVIRGDKVIFADKVDVLAFVECDGTSMRGGTTRMSLSTGEIFEAKFELLTPCIASWIHGTVCIDNFSRVTWGDKVGVGCFEGSTNIQGGARRPRVFDAGTIEANGWHPFQR